MASKLKLKNNLGNTFTLEHTNDTGDVTLTSKDILTNTITVDTMADLVALDTSKQDKVWLLGYHTKGDKEPVLYHWDSTMLSTEHNGGTVISPNANADSIDDEAFKSFWYTPNPPLTGSGCWYFEPSGSVNVKDFGAKGDGVTDDTLALQSCLNSSVNSGKKEKVKLQGSYYLSQPLSIDPTVNTHICGQKSKLISTQKVLNIANTPKVSTTVATSVSFGDYYIHLNSTEDVKKGQLLVVRSTEPTEEVERSGLKESSFIVSDIDGDTVYLETSSRISFDVTNYTASAYFYDVGSVNVEDIVFETSMTSGEAVVLCNNVANVKVSGCSIYDPTDTDRRLDTSVSGLQFNRSANIEVLDTKISNMGYAIYFTGTVNSCLRKIHSHKCRHLENTALGSALTIINNCTADSCYSGFDMHQESLDAYFYHCESVNDSIASKLRGRCAVVENCKFEKFAAYSDSGLLSDIFTGDEYMFIRRELRNVEIGRADSQFVGQNIGDDGISANILILENVKITNHGWDGVGDFVTLTNVHYDYENLPYPASFSSGYVIPSASKKLTCENITLLGNPSDTSLISGVGMSSPYNAPMTFYINNFIASNLFRFIRCNLSGDSHGWYVSNGIISNCQTGISLAATVSWGGVDNVTFKDNTSDISGTLLKSTTPFTLS